MSRTTMIFHLTALKFLSLSGHVDVNGQFLPLARVAMWGQDSLTQTRKSHYTHFVAPFKFKNEEMSLFLCN